MKLSFQLKLLYSEKATKFYEIFPLLLTTVHTVKSKGKISQNFMALSEYLNFINKINNYIVISSLLQPYFTCKKGPKEHETLALNINVCYFHCLDYLEKYCQNLSWFSKIFFIKSD